jgi:SAM-dependent methyltransferase
MAYEYFYQYYDSLMDDVPYDQFINIVKAYAKNTDKILDLGCGTGTVLIKLLKSGFDVDGIDLSDEMLLATQNKLKAEYLSTNLYQDDMKEFSINDEYNIIFSFLDSINYITSKKDLEKTFKNVFHALKTDGYFIFDIHSINKVLNVFDGYSYGENLEDFSYIWNTFVETKTDHAILYHELTFFIKEKNGFYQKRDEFHKQVVYNLDVYQNLLEKAHFKIEKILYDLDGKNCESSDDRIILICRKPL